jgi:hypothetical protein
VRIAREVYDFVTGGSVAAPAGLAAALIVAHFSAALAPGLRAALFVAVLLLGFVASAAVERAS